MVFGVIIVYTFCRLSFFLIDFLQTEMMSLTLLIPSAFSSFSVVVSAYRVTVGKGTNYKTCSPCYTCDHVLPPVVGLPKIY